MNSNIDPLKTYFQEPKAGGGSSDEENIWNLLVQILLPLVLILTFIVVSEVIGFKEAYIHMQEIMGADLREEENPPDLIARQQAIIDAQLQRLLLALEQVKIDEEKRLNITMFPQAEFVQRKGIYINDDNFKKLCRESKGIYQSGYSRQRYADNIYSQVLEKSEIKDRNIDLRVRRWEKKKDVEDISEVEKFRRLMGAKKSMIYQENRKIIHNYILDFIDATEKSIADLQEDLIKFLFRDLIINPEDLDKESSLLVDRIIDTNISDEDREMSANQLYRRIIKKWRSKHDSDGYTFLKASWIKLSTI